ncbi:MAG: hypothetical protein ACXAAO_12835, partial [Candidatus Thorarchaeota archaeon]
RRNETMQILSRLIPQPIANQELASEMKDLVPHLVKIGVLNEENGLLSLGFPLFTLNDYQLMNDSLEKTAQSVVDALKEDWSQISEIVNSISKSSNTPTEEKIYNILGCVILDWFSLGWLSEENLIFYKKEQPHGSKYLLQGITKEAYQKSFSRFCYSTTGGTEKWRFSVFGQANDKRWITPELQMHQSNAIRKHLFAPEPLPSVTASFSQIANYHLIAQIIDVLVIGDAGRTTIEESLNLDSNASEAIERYLIESKIIEMANKTNWIPRSMILTLDDKEPLDELSRLTKGKIVEAVANEIENLRKGCEGTTSEKHGVPFVETMTELWHDIFSRTIKTFLADKLMKTMYTEGQTSFSSFIWENDAIVFTL